VSRKGAKNLGEKEGIKGIPFFFEKYSRRKKGKVDSEKDPEKKKKKKIAALQPSTKKGGVFTRKQKRNEFNILKKGQNNQVLSGKERCRLIAKERK